MEKTFLTIDEASKYLGLAKQTIYGKVHTKTLKHYKPSGKTLYFKLSDLEAYIQAGEVKTQAEIENEAIKRLI